MNKESEYLSSIETFEKLYKTQVLRLLNFYYENECTNTEKIYDIVLKENLFKSISIYKIFSDDQLIKLFKSKPQPDEILSFAMIYACKYDKLKFIGYLLKKLKFDPETCIVYSILSSTTKTYEYFMSQFPTIKKKKFTYILEETLSKPYFYHICNVNLLLTILINHSTLEKPISQIFDKFECLTNKERYDFFRKYIQLFPLKEQKRYVKFYLEIIFVESNYFILKYIHKHKLASKKRILREFIPEEFKNLPNLLFLKKLEYKNECSFLLDLYSHWKEHTGKKLLELWFSPNGLGGIKAKVELTKLFN